MSFNTKMTILLFVVMVSFVTLIFWLAGFNFNERGFMATAYALLISGCAYIAIDIWIGDRK